MHLRTPFIAILNSLACAGLCATAGAAGAPAPAPAASSAVAQASIETLHQRMRAGDLSAYSLVQSLIARIARLDHDGPQVNALIQLNPGALDAARRCDQAMEAGAHGALQCIPVLLKDNIDTAGPMLTTAGSLALAGAPAAKDAPVVARLRRAGAIILGKTNLSEWANFRSSHASSGWSGRGGLTRNPYALDRSACGSSSGSGAAVAAGFATVALGTETDGSVVCPSAANGIVGIKPTLGLVSRTGIVPISHNQDTAGPMARSVTDAAILLGVMAGSDTADKATAEADKHATDYTKYLDRDALKGKRIGVVRALAGYDPNTDAILEQSIAALKSAGATIVDPVKVPHLDDYGKAEMTVLLYDFKHDLNAYLATRKGLAVHSLAELIDWNKAHAAQEMPWFGQDLFVKAQAKGPLSDAEYTKALAKAKRLSGPEGIDAALAKYHLDALLAPTQGPAWTTDLVVGDHYTGSSSSPAAVAGYPDITVPAGFVHGLPVGMSFFAGKWSEPTLIGIAYAFEQATRARREPHFLPTVPQPPATTAIPAQPSTATPATATSAAR
ncbi:MAG TPA: amidase [Rhodanobacteraceae bacterium]|nr:amidase [Rhodanobacteraceae bacterium]